jgi:SAM-dependent methyltransferase
MTIYERGNAAKQWMLEELDRRYSDRPVRILDLAGGSGRIWQTFLATHPHVHVTVVDTDAKAITDGKGMYRGNAQIDLRLADAQRPLGEAFDVVVAMSAIEHVVNRPAFLATVWFALAPGGAAYLNYDVGHFRSCNIKERIMVPVSQLLALFKIEGPYMKKVNDAKFRAQAEKQGFRVEFVKKHNLSSLKGFMRGASDEALREWFAFEERMNSMFPPDELDRVMFSTTLVVTKP